MDSASDGRVEAILWEDGVLRLLDQRALPATEVYVECRTADAVASAIREMVVRGAPAIGIVAAYGVALAARARLVAKGSWSERLAPAFEQLAASRPTAVNLFWALDRMRRRVANLGEDPVAELSAEAEAIHSEDRAQNLAMGGAGARLIEPGSQVLTHCNTGSLATGGHGTALGVIRSAFADGRIKHVYATETRPWLQGARLTAWELARDGIPASLLVDSAAAQLMARERIDWLIVGADRIAGNGDVANKIGTYALAVLARHHRVRVMVVAPSGTIDMSLAAGGLIPIEDRDPGEIWRATGAGAAPAGLRILNPAFDITPAALIDVIVTERGVVSRPCADGMKRLFSQE